MKQPRCQASFRENVPRAFDMETAKGVTVAVRVDNNRVGLAIDIN